MDISTVVSVTGGFFKFAGEILADLKRNDLARIDVDMLELKRTQLTEKFEEFKSELTAAAKKEKARLEQDMISRGLTATTARVSMLQAVDRDASSEFEKVAREYNRAMEEIALMERRVREQARSWWRKLCGR